MPWIGGGLKPITMPSLEVGVERAEAPAPGCARPRLGSCALRPVLQRDEGDAGIGLLSAGQEVEAGEGDDVGDRRILRSAPRVASVVTSRVRVERRRPAAAMRHQEDVALVLVRHEAAGNALEQGDQVGPSRCTKPAMPSAVRRSRKPHAAGVARRQPGEDAVEARGTATTARHAPASGSARASAGVSVSATMPEITTETAMVTANCR